MTQTLFSNSTIFLLSIDEASDKRTYTTINTIVKYSLDNLKPHMKYSIYLYRTHKVTIYIQQNDIKTTIQYVRFIHFNTLNITSMERDIN